MHAPPCSTHNPDCGVHTVSQWGQIILNMIFIVLVLGA